MKRSLHRLLVIVAAAMHLAAPVAAYATPSSGALPGDVCSASRPAAPVPVDAGIPAPGTSEHHCAHAPCCAGGGATGAALPPGFALPLHVAFPREVTPAANAVVAPVPPVASAQPRGPPLSL
jgi:hypothetical protein